MKKKSGAKLAIEVLDELNKLSTEELRKKVEQYKGKKHWAAEALVEASRTKLLLKKIKEKKNER